MTDEVVQAWADALSAHAAFWPDAEAAAEAAGAIDVAATAAVIRNMWDDTQTRAA